jgi:hypothetical protein
MLAQLSSFGRRLGGKRTAEARRYEPFLTFVHNGCDCGTKPHVERCPARFAIVRFANGHERRLLQVDIKILQ